ncbi:hypothetical protein AHF37_05939 [Paragonimus kellicotti]|nr:hypothetical protein AHF37_05939 [Paragonimus kellicotti]
MNTASGKQWDVIIGGTHLLVPEGYLSDLEKLSYPPGQAPSPGGSGMNVIVGAGGEPVATVQSGQNSPKASEKKYPNVQTRDSPPPASSQYNRKQSHQSGPT